MVLGGSSNTALKKKIELVNAHSEQADSGCDPILDFPEDTNGAVMTYIQGQLLVCAKTSLCYTYDKTVPSWTNTVNTTVPRNGAAGILLNDTHWWVVGGNGLYSSEIYSHPDNSFSPGINTTRASDSYQIIKLNDTAYALGVANEVHLLQDGDWTQIPGPTENHGHGVFGVVTNSSGVREVVFAAGHDSGTITDIFNFESWTWRTLGAASNTPDLIHGKFLQYADSVISVGGDYSRKSLYYFDHEDYAWRSLTVELLVDRGFCCDFPYILGLPQDFADCTN